MLPVEQPFKTYTGLDGKPLNDGYVYFGQPDQNPITAPVTVFWDSAGTIPAAQPLRTVNGYIMRGGSPANVFFDGAYSELVQDSKKRQVFYARTSDEFSIATAVKNFLTAIAGAAGSSLMGFIQAGVGAVQRTMQDKARDFVAIEDFGGDAASADNTVAFARAAATQLPIKLREGATYITGPIVPPTNGRLCIYALGQGATIQLKAGSNDHLIKNTTKAEVWLGNVRLDGNRAANSKGSVNPGVVFNQVGTLIMIGGKVYGGVHDQILSGNVDYNYDGSKVAERVYLQDVEVDGGVQADNAQDCYRIFRTKSVDLINCKSTGGLSGARIGYYCDDVRVIGGHYRDSWADVGVTVYFTGRFILSGVTSTGHYQHSFEIDAANNGVITGCVGTGSRLNGILFTEYGPATNSPSFAGTYDGITTSYPNVYPCRGVLVTGSVFRGNGKAGMKCIGQGTGLTIRGNTIEGNNTSNDPNENCGLYISGGTLNDDAVTLGQNTFVNSGNQAFSVRQSNVQFNTASEGNIHIGGRHFEFPVRGPRTSFARDAAFNTACIATTLKGTVVADDLAIPGRYARQLNDADGTGDVTLEWEIPVPAGGYKTVVVKLRTPDTMNSAEIYVNLYDGATYKDTAFDITTALTTSYKTVVGTIPTSWSSTNYDRVRVGVKSSIPFTGHINVQSVEVFGDTEY